MAENLSEKESESKKEKCFVMMPISNQGDYPSGHFDRVYEHIFRPAIEAAGYEAYRVDENKICDSIIGKIFKAIQECPMAICDLSNRNPNVLYELGIRQAYDKPVVLVQDEKTERIFDVAGINTITYSSKRLYEEVLKNREDIREAILSTKDGEQNSILKVVGVKNAEIHTVNVSKEDKIEIMLRGLTEDVKNLKNRELLIDVSREKKNFTESIWGQEIFVISLRNGVTNKQISESVRKVELSFGVRIEWERESSNMTVNLKDIDALSRQLAINVFESDLS